MNVLVIIPTHDRTEFYREAIDSVFVQTRQADELVITGNVGPGVITNASLADRINQAIEQSHCDAFVILCDDDQLKPDYIERTARAMELTGVDVVYTDCQLFGYHVGVGQALGEWTRQNIDRNTVPLVTSLCSRRAWVRAGGFEDVPFFDWDFWWRCFYTGATAKWIREPLWSYRTYPENSAKRDYLELSRKEALARQDALRKKLPPSGVLHG